MIPKIIHYTWFSGEPYPEKIQECLDSWKKNLPDYEFRLWDADSIKDIDSVWVKESISVRKWAFAADYVRLYAVFNYGGIYMDTDCLIYKSFDPLLGKAFINREDYIHVQANIAQQYLGSHCFGAEKGNPFIGRCLDYYKDRHFIRTSNTSLPDCLKYDQTLLPYIQYLLASDLGYSPLPSQGKSIQDLGEIVVYPFNMFNHSKDSFCNHLALGEWRKNENGFGTFKRSLISIVLSPLQKLARKRWYMIRLR